MMLALRSSTCHVVYAALVFTSLLVTLSPAQNQSPSTRPVDSETQRTSAFLTESAEARQALDAAVSLKEAGEFERAIRACDQVLETYGDSLLKLHEDFYMPVARKMGSILRDGDETWIDACREHLSQRAQAALDNLGEHPTPQELLSIAQRWWLTAAGGEATYRAAIQMHEGGQPRRATLTLLDLGDPLMDTVGIAGHPDNSERADWLFAQALMLGQDPSYPGFDSKHALKAINKVVGLDGSIWWRGKSMHVRDAWQSLRELDPPQPESHDYWPMWGGDVSHSRVGTLAGEPLQLLWTTQMSPAWGAGRDWRAPGDGIGGHVSLPVTDRQHVFIQDANRIRAIGLHHGLTHWEYAMAPDGPSNAERPMGASTRGPMVPAVHEGLVYAILGNERDNPFTEQRERWESCLTCLCAGSGSVLWRISAETIARLIGYESATPPQNTWWWFDGSPLVYENAVYTVIRRQQHYGFEDCYLARFDRLTGRCVWWTHVASGNVGRGGNMVVTRCDPAPWQNDLHVYTNLGTLTCVSSITGKVEWHRAIPSAAAMWADLHKLNVTRQSWTVHPLVVAYESAEERRRQIHHECLVTVDQTSRELIVIGFGSRVRSRISPETLGFPETVLGPHEGVVYAIGDDVLAFNLNSKEVLWRQNILRPGEFLDGMACLTDEGIWIPTDHALTWISLQGKGPQRWTWTELGLTGEAAHQGGNLLALGDILLSVRRTHVAAWSCGKRALALLDFRRDASLGDPEVHLALARYFLLTAHDWNQGLAALEHAVALANDIEIHPYGDTHARARIHRLAATLLTRAVETLADKSNGTTGGTVDQRIAQWADLLSELDVSREALISAWSAIARLAEDRGQWSEAVMLWQNLVVLISVDDRSELLVEHRREAIDAQARILKRHGRAAFGSYDGMASELFSKHDLNPDEESARTLIEAFPYFEGTPEFLLHHAERLHEQNRTREAYECLLLAWSRYAEPSFPNWPDIDETALIRQFVITAMENHQWRRAAFWIHQGAARMPDARIDMNGREATFAEHATRIQADRSLHPERRPTLSFPLQKGPEIKVEDDEKLFPPEQGIDLNHAGAPLPLWICIDRDRWRAYEPASGTWLWQRQRVEGAMPSRIIPLGEQVLIASPHLWLSLNRSDGAKRWTWGQAPATWNDPRVDPEIWRRLVNTASNDLWVTGVWDDGVMELIRLRDGRRMWRRDAGQPFRRPMAMGELCIAHASRKNDRTAIVVLDLLSGRERCTIECSDDRLIHGMHFTPDGRLFIQGSDWLASYDPRTGDESWSHSLEPGERIAMVHLDGLRVYLALQGGNIVARERATGKYEWTHVPDEKEGIVKALLRHGEDLYVIRAEGVETLNTARGMPRARLNSPSSGRIHRAWLTREGIAGLIQLEGSPDAAMNSPKPWVLAFWPRTEVGALNDANTPQFPETVVDLGSFARIYDAHLADGALTLHADDALITWTGKNHP